MSDVVSNQDALQLVDGKKVRFCFDSCGIMWETEGWATVDQLDGCLCIWWEDPTEEFECPYQRQRNGEPYWCKSRIDPDRPCSCIDPAVMFLHDLSDAAKQEIMENGTGGLVEECDFVVSGFPGVTVHVLAGGREVGTLRAMR